MQKIVFWRYKPKRFSFFKIVLLISLTREKYSHNVVKTNLSRIQFCNLINKSYFCEHQYTSHHVHIRRETIVKIIPVSTGSSFVYIIISKFGHVGIYDDKLRLQRKYEIDIDTDPDSDLDVGASDPGWITDAIWMDNSKHMVYTSSLRYIL